MKICFLTHNVGHDNGGGVFSSHLIMGLRDMLGADVVALTTVPSGCEYERPLLRGSPLFFFRILMRVRSIIRHCDVVHAIDVFPYGVIAALASVGLKKKIIITVVGTGSIGPLYHPIWAYFARYAYRRADKIIAISAFTRGEILARIPNLSISVIHPGIDRWWLSPGRIDGKHPSAHQPYIISVGSLRWRKGYTYSIRAFAKISRIFPDMSYVIVGKKYSEKYIRQLHDIIRDEGVEGRVHILDTINAKEELYILYRDAELFCLLSQNFHHDVEGFGMVFLEAASAGLPVVGSRGGGVYEAVRDGRNGFLVDSRNINECAEAMARILKDGILRKTMSKESLVFARSMDWTEKNKQYCKIYKQVFL